MASTPSFDFTSSDSLSPWNIPPLEWLKKNNKPWTGLAVAALVFNPSGRLLIVQRAAHDSMPNKWEVPGGAVDDDDPSLLHAAARELWEEAGLVARHFSYIVTEGRDREPGYEFSNRTGTERWGRISFAADVDSCDRVTLDPNEHQDYAWATEEEVRNQKVGHRSTEFTSKDTQGLLLEGFRLRKESGQPVV